MAIATIVTVAFICLCVRTSAAQEAQSVMPGERYELDCIMKNRTCSELVHLYWYFNGELVVYLNDSISMVDKRFQGRLEHVETAYGSVLIIDPVVEADTGIYSCDMLTSDDGCDVEISQNITVAVTSDGGNGLIQWFPLILALFVSIAADFV